MTASQLLNRSVRIFVGLALVACSNSNPAAPAAPTSYILFAIDGVPTQGDQLYLFPDGYFNRNGSQGGTYVVAGAEITLAFSCSFDGGSCPASWSGTLTVKTPPSPSPLDLREDNGTGRLRQYQRGFEL